MKTSLLFAALLAVVLLPVAGRACQAFEGKQYCVGDQVIGSHLDREAGPMYALFPKREAFIGQITGFDAARSLVIVQDAGPKRPSELILIKELTASSCTEAGPRLCPCDTFAEPGMRNYQMVTGLSTQQRTALQLGDYDVLAVNTAYFGPDQSQSVAQAQRRARQEGHYWLQKRRLMEIQFQSLTRGTGCFQPTAP